MAEDKKSFILYADLLHTVRKMPPDKAGELFLTILSYVNDENPVPNDLLVEIAFEPVKQQLKRDLRRWEDFREKQSLNGKRGGRPKNPTEETENPKKPSLLEESQKSLNVTVNVNDTVNGGVLPPPPEINESKSFEKQLFYNMEAMVASTHWERVREFIYMKTYRDPKKDKNFVREVASKYDLHLAEKNIWVLGLTPNQFAAGVAKWVINEPNFTK